MVTLTRGSESEGSSPLSGINVMRYEVLIDGRDDYESPLDAVIIYVDKYTNMDYVWQWFEMWYGEALWDIKRM